MKPIEIARNWAKQNSNYQGLLLLIARTGRGKRSRWGKKRTTYTYLVSGGKATRLTYSYKSNIGNGVCDVTGNVHHKKEMGYYHLPHPQKGEYPFPGEKVVYGTAWIYTSKEIAKKMGAQPGRGDGTASYDGYYSEQHPEYRRGLDAWQNRKEIEP